MPTTVRTIRDRVPEDFFGDSRDLARQILAELLSSKSLAVEVLTPVVAAEIDRLIRDRVRTLEAEVSLAIQRHPVKPGRNGERQWRIALDRKHAFLSQRFATGDGTRVTWGDATIDQHVQRIKMLRTQVAGLDATIARHEAAVKALTDAGVDCLNALPALPEGLVAA